VLISRDVYALVDWDTARRCAWLGPMDAAKLRTRGAAAQLQATYDVLAQIVGSIFAGKSRVRPRFYHGWHRGNQPTVDRNALVGVDPHRRAISDVLIEPPVIADTLLCGAQLRDTLRRRTDGSDEQKMVDTALCADLLWLARAESTRKDNVAFLVLSEDDDMLPAVLTAGQWGFWAKVARLREANRCMPQSRASIHVLSSLATA
jgi:hypothetical protein